jgi:uncharacterized protein YfkK (UPF0435 family)
LSLQQPSPENLSRLIELIKEQLNMVNAAVIRSEDYSLSDYDDIYSLYEFVANKQGNLTMFEIEGVLDELRSLKASK